MSDKAEAIGDAVSSAPDAFTIRDLADAFAVTTRAIRFYEDEGLLSPRREGQARLFSRRDRTRLKLILRGKRLGFSLAGIREIIDMYDAAPGEAGQLDLFLRRIAARRAELESKRRDIEETLAELAELELRSRQRLAQLAPGREGKEMPNASQ